MEYNFDRQTDRQTDRRIIADRIFQIISGIFLVLIYIGFVWFIKTKVSFFLNSDDSSELILGKLLSEENKLLSKNWYYSTELRVVNTQIFYAFFFKIFSSWHSVRIASLCCLYIVLIAAYCFACKALKVKRYFLITAALLLIPFSKDYFSIVLKGAYYIPHISITFFTLGLCESYVSREKEKREKIYLPIAFTCAFLAGLGGPRQLLILYIPLAVTSIGSVVSRMSMTNGKINLSLEKGDKRHLLFATVSFVGAVAGYIINTGVLSKIYSFELWDDAISFTWLDFSRVPEIVNGFLSSYGYSNGKIFGSSLLSNFLCFCWIFLTVWACVHILKNKNTVEPAHYRMALFTIADFAVFVLLYMFTNHYLLGRYNLPIIVLSIPMIAILFKDVQFEGVINYVAVTIFVLLVAWSGFLFCKEQYKVDNTGEFRAISTALQEEGYTQGYATFWQANVLTELSDGAIEVWDWEQSGTGQPITVESIDEVYDWLQLKSHAYTHPEGKVFLLFTLTEWENNPWVGKLSTEHTIYHSAEYIVIGYDSYEQLKLDTTQE